MESKPSGFETFFARSADEFAKAGGPDMDKIVEIHWEHGIEFLRRIRADNMMRMPPNIPSEI